MSCLVTDTLNKVEIICSPGQGYEGLDEDIQMDLEETIAVLSASDKKELFKRYATGLSGIDEGWTVEEVHYLAHLCGVDAFIKIYVDGEE